LNNRFIFIFIIVLGEIYANATSDLNTMNINDKWNELI